MMAGWTVETIRGDVHLEPTDRGWVAHNAERTVRTAPQRTADIAECMMRLRIGADLGTCGLCGCERELGCEECGLD